MSHRTRRPLLRSLLPAALVLGAGLTAGPLHADSELPSKLPAYTPDANAPRSEVPDVYKWDLSPMFESREAWQQGYDQVRTGLDELEGYQGHLSDPKKLLAALEQYFQVHDLANNVQLYGALSWVTDVSDTEAAEMYDQGGKLMLEVMERAGFLRIALLSLSDKDMKKAFRKARGLERHRPYIENLRRRQDRLLSEDAERVLALAGDNLWAEIDLNEIVANPEKTFDALLQDIEWPTIHDAQGEEVQLTLSNYARYRSSPHREVRREAVTAFLGTLRQYQHVLASTLSGQAELNVLFARARGYDTALEAYLDKDAIDPAVFTNLIDTIHANLEPLHRYVALRKQALSLDEVHLYDLYIPLVESDETEMTFEQARSTILEALDPLGEDYLSVMSEGLDPENGWLDLYPSKNKISGAFCAGVYDKHPYVMMNYQDRADDMSTLAHEYGHAMHSWLSIQNQPYSTFRYVPFLAEIASTANEALLTDYLLERTEDPVRRANLLVDRMESIRRTIYRQALFAEFEWKVHQFVEAGTPVTAELLSETYADLIRQYYGPEYAIDEDDGMEWAYVGHFYYKYYLFVYATGLSSGLAIADRIQEGGPEAVDAFMTMLEGGATEPPLTLLRNAGVDLTRPEAITGALSLFDETLTELEGLLDELPAPEAPAESETGGEDEEGEPEGEE